MTNEWDKTTQITHETVKELLLLQFSIRVHDIQLLGSGFDNTAYLINHEFVFRFPHRDEALDGLENEIALLPSLAAQLPFMVSSPIFIGNPTSMYRYPFAGYKMLPGTMLSEFQTPLVSSINFAKIVGLWLKTLHALPVLKEHVSILKGNHTWRLDVLNRTSRVQEIVAKYGDYFVQHGFDPKILADKMDSFKDLDTTITQQSYVHGDLYSKHIMVDASGLPSGLIDWGDIHIGHPAIDLAVGFIIFTQEALQEFLKTYGEVNQNVIKVAIFRAYSHSILGFPYFVQIKESASIMWAKAALQNILNLI